MEWKGDEQMHGSEARTTEEPGGPVQQGLPNQVKGKVVLLVRLVASGTDFFLRE